MAAPLRKKIIKDYYFEVLIRKTYHIKSISKSEAGKVVTDLNKGIIPENAEMIEDATLKTRLITNSINKITSGKAIGWN